MLELPPERGRDPDDLARLRLEIVEPRANDGLHRVGQRQRLVRPRRRPRRRARSPRPVRAAPAHLLEKERIAAGAIEEALRQPLRDVAGAEHGPMIAADAAKSSGSSDNVGSGRPLLGRRDSGRVVTTKSEPLRRDDLPHPDEDGARRAVGPVPVLEQHDERRGLDSTANSAASASSSAACRCSPCRWRGSGCESLGTERRCR